MLSHDLGETEHVFVREVVVPQEGGGEDDGVVGWVEAALCECGLSGLEWV